MDYNQVYLDDMEKRKKHCCWLENDAQKNLGEHGNIVSIVDKRFCDGSMDCYKNTIFERIYTFSDGTKISLEPYRCNMYLEEQFVY